MAFEVDTDAVLRCSSRLKQIEQHAADITALAADADPEWHTWGLVGAPFAVVYRGFAEELHRNLGQLGAALGNRVEALDACAENYATQEAAVLGALKGIEELLP
jgi:hypothetical protein